MPRAGTSRSDGTGTSRSRRTGSRSSWPDPDGSRATVLSALRPTDLPALGLGPARGRRHLSRPLPAGVADVRARRPRDPARRRAAVAGHRGRPRAERAACRGVRVVGGEPRARPVDGRAPVHLGRSVRRRRPGRRAPARLGPRGGDRVGVRFGDTARRRTRRPSAARSRSRPWPPTASSSRPEPRSIRSPTPPCGPTSRLMAGSSPTGHVRRDGGEGAAGRPHGAAVAATFTLAPGERRSVRFALAWDFPTVEFGAGRRWWKRYTRDWGRTGDRAWDLADLRPRRGARVAGRDRGLAGAGPRRSRPARLVQDGTLQRALLPRRRRHLLGARRGRRARAAGRPRRAASRCSSASTTPSTTPSTSTSTPRSRSSSSSRSSRPAASATCSRPSPSTTPRS